MACPPPLAPDTVNCSGRGIACEDLQCVCEEGWTGRGDFVVGSPACQTHKVTVQVLYGILGVLYMFTAAYAIYFMWAKFQKMQMLRKAAMNSSTASKVARQGTGFRLGLTALVAAVSMVVVGFIKVSNPERTIGNDVPLTVMFSIGSTAVWLFIPWLCITFLILALRSLKLGKSNEARQHLLQIRSLFKKVLPFLWTMAFFGGLIPICTLAHPEDPTYMFAFAACHYLGLLVCMLVFGVVALRSLGIVLEDLEKALSVRHDDALQKVFNKLKFAKREIRNQMIIQMIMATLFAFWMYLQRFASYQIPIAYMGGSTVLLAGLHVLFPLGSRETSNSGATTQESNQVANASNLQLQSPGGGGSSQILAHQQSVEDFKSGEE